MTVERRALVELIAPHLVAELIAAPAGRRSVADRAREAAEFIVDAITEAGWAVVDPRAAVGAVLADLGVPEFTCAGPTAGLHCGRTTHHPTDVAEGYCPACHHYCGTAEQVRRGHRAPSTVDGPPSTTEATGP